MKIGRILLGLLVVTHYLLWIHHVSPLPLVDSLPQYVYPVQNYLQANLSGITAHQFLRSEFFSNHYPSGGAVIAWLYAFMGAENAILKEPYLLNLIVILPFLWAIEFLQIKKKYYLLLGICFYFFPPTQICIKQFSLHGINLAYALLGFLYLRSYLAARKKKKTSLLIGFMFCFGFSAIAKHLGAVIFINLVLAYISWLVLGGHQHFDRANKRAIIIAFIGVLILLMPFYNWSYQLEYIQASVGHNPAMNYLTFLLSAAVFLCLLPATALILRPFSRQYHLPKLFRSGYALCLFSPCLLALLSHRLFWPAHIPIFIIGYLLIILFILYFNLSSLRGFVYLFILINGVHLAILFGSGAAYTSYTFLCTIIFMGVQTVAETNSLRFYILAAITVVVLSNFFPSIHSLDHWFGLDGKRVYTHLFHSPHQNPLGWQNFGYGELKKQVISQWSEVRLPKEPLFLVENFGAYTSAQFVFFHNIIYPFPPMQVLEAGSLYQKMYQEYLVKKEKLFAELVDEMSIPLILYADKPLLEEREAQPLQLNKLLSEKEFSIDTVNDDLFVFAFNQAIIDWAIDNHILTEKYNCLKLPAEKPLAISCVDKRLSATSGVNFGQQELTKLLKRYTNKPY